MEGLLPLEGFENPGPRKVTVEGVENAVAAVLLNTFAPQLSRALDFVVPAKLDAAAQVGSLVKVKVSGKEYTGVIAARKDSTDWLKPLQEIRRVVSPWPLLDESTLELLETVSLHYGTGPGVLLRYALPVRRAKIEADFETEPLDLTTSAPAVDEDGGTWASYEGGKEFLSELKEGGYPRAVVSALPRVDGTASGELPSTLRKAGLPARFLPLAELVKPVWARGEQSLLILPTAEEAGETYLFLRRYFVGREDSIALYTSTMPQTSAYESFLKARFGRAAVIVATRGGVFLPLRFPGLFFCWDDMALSLSSDMFPNFSARQVLLQRATQTGRALVFAHFSVSAGDLQLVQRGFARKLAPTRDTLRAATPRFQFLDFEGQMWEGPTSAMLIPARALKIAREGLRRGPVLVLIPRDSKFSVVSCVNCGTNATCRVCGGPLSFNGSRLECSRCGVIETDFVCHNCGSSKVRGRLLQSRTVIEDIGRMFKDIPVLVSKPGAGFLSQIGDEPRLVIANSGAEPVAAGGYQAALILRAHMLASRTALWTAQEVMRRFLAAAALVAPGRTVFVTEPLGTLWEQSLIRWDPWGAAEVDLRERQVGHFAPAWRTALLQGPKLAGFLEELQLVLPEALVLGPVESSTQPGFEAAFVSVSLKESEALGKVLRSLNFKSGATGNLLVEIDPGDPAGQVA